MPGGYRYADGSFGVADTYGDWWSATEGSGGDAYYRRMTALSVNVDEYSNSKEDGFAVRCAKD